MRIPIARRIRLKVDLAGSHASAEAAATASADFDILVDGVSSATMRFAAAATSATFIAVFDERVDLENATYADDDSPPVIRQRRSLRIEEDKRLLGCDGAEERVEHRKLVTAFLNPELIEFEVGLEFGSEVDLVGLGTVRDSVVRILHHPGERNSRSRIGRMLEVAFLEMFVSGVVAIGVANPPSIAEGRHECSAFCGTCR